jgi:hypothetical protein
MKKLLVGLFAVVLSIGLFACGQDDAVENPIAMESDSQVFTVEALSAASLLDSTSIASLSYVPLAETTEEEVLVEEEIDEIDQYLQLMEQFLGDNNGLSVNVLESDREAFDFLVSFTTVDVLGNPITYYLYYNETVYDGNDDVDDDLTTTEVVTTEEEVTTTEEEVTTTEETTEEATTQADPVAQQERTFYFEEADDANVTYLLQGVIVNGEVEYSVEGKRLEFEDGSIVNRLFAYLDRDNFVKVSYKLDPEDSKTKFFFEVKENGIIINKSRVLVVEEDGSTVVHLQLEDETQKAKYSFNIIEEDGVTLIHIKYDIRVDGESRETGNIHIQVTEDPETGELVYTYRIVEGKQGGQYQYRKEIEKTHGKPGEPKDKNPGNGKMGA